MKICFALIGTFLLVAMGCQKSEPTPPSQPASSPSSGGNPITAPVDYLGAVAKAKHAADKTINFTALNSAIQQFNAMEDRLPSSLNELVEKHYLQASPTAPAGMKFAYNPKTGEVKLVPQ